MVARAKTERKRTTQARRHIVEVKGHHYTVTITPPSETGLDRDLVQVSSKSEPDGMRTVGLSEMGDRPIKCTCEGWVWHGDCNHQRAVREALAREAVAATPPPTPTAAAGPAWRMIEKEAGQGVSVFSPLNGPHFRHTVTVRFAVSASGPWWEAARCTCRAEYEVTATGIRSGDAALATERYIWLAVPAAWRRPGQPAPEPQPARRREGRDIL